MDKQTKEALKLAVEWFEKYNLTNFDRIAEQSQTYMACKEALQSEASEQEPVHILNFEKWWHETRSLAPSPSDDIYQHCKKIAWMGYQHGIKTNESKQKPVKPPKWYRRDEFTELLRKMNYSTVIQEELADLFLRHCQYSFNKGFQKAIQERVILKFPVMLRKMWSGIEVQTWIDDAIKDISYPTEFKTLTDDEIVAKVFEDDELLNRILWIAGASKALKQALKEKNHG